MGDEVRSLVRALVDAVERTVSSAASRRSWDSTVRGLPSCGRSPVAPPAGRRSAGASPNRCRHGRAAALPACRPWAAWRARRRPQRRRRRRVRIGVGVGARPLPRRAGDRPRRRGRRRAGRPSSWPRSPLRGAPAGCWSSASTSCWPGPRCAAHPPADRHCSPGSPCPASSSSRPLTSHLPGPRRADRARLDAACRVGRSAGRLRRRHRPHRGTNRHDRRRLDHRRRSVWSCSSAAARVAVGPRSW